MKDTFLTLPFSFKILFSQEALMFRIHAKTVISRATRSCGGSEVGSEDRNLMCSNVGKIEIVATLWKRSSDCVSVGPRDFVC